MSTPAAAPPPGRSDTELAALDVPIMLRYGLGQDGPHRHTLFADGAVAAAIRADLLGVPPRALSYLAEVVRAGGTRYAAQLPEPLVGAEAAALARDWLDAAAAAVGDAGLDGDALVARWLDAVAAIVALRVAGRSEHTGGQR